MTSKLSNICFYAKGKVAVKSLTKANYVSTENMLPNRGGVVNATTLPTIKDTQGYCVGDVLVSNIRPYFKKIWFADSNGGCSNDVLVFRAKEGVDARYLYYVLADDSFFNYSNATSKGTKMPRGDKSAIMDYIIEEHSLIEQHRIADILSALDKKIANNNAINDNLQQQAQALFKAWFVDYIPWNGNSPEWEQGVLSDYVTVKRGGSPRPIQEYLSDSGYRWLKISDVTSLQTPFITSIAEHIKESGINKTVFLKSGCLVLSNSATPGIPKILDLDSCIHDGWLYFPYSEFSNEFLYLLFLHIRPSLVALGNGSVFTNLKTDILKAYPIMKPPKDVLTAFDEIVKPIFMAILHNTREISRLTALRDTLLPRLMSGEIDVSEVDI